MADINEEDIELEDSGEGVNEEDSEFSSSESDEGVSDTGLTENQNRLLYMISLFTKVAKNDTEVEEWVRKQALLVLIYEAIVAQVLDFDYAPSSELVENRRKYFNISQEGRSDVDFLREEELINGLRLSSKTYQPVTCYQISEKGLDVLSKLSRADKEAVEELVYAPGTRDIVNVEWDGEDYWIAAKNGFRRQSTVTDCEDVSYVSSAYVPQCLRHGGRPTLSNAHRAHECAVSDSNIRDELDEVITLNSVSIIVSEWIPFGANQIVQLNQNLGSTERVQGGFFTALMDDDSAGTKFTVPPGLTSVNILDYTLTNHINFEADIHFPEPPGVVQVEMFGCSINMDGTCFYGMQIEAVMDRIKDNISLDHLSRLLVDVHIDSSKIIDSVISSYQRTLLNLVFMNDAPSRDKVNLLIANEITPHLTAEEYMDKGEYENELKQVLGDTRAAFDISEHDTLVFGAHGILVAGPNARHHEPLLCSYMQFQAMDIFVRNFFNRMFIATDDMKQIKALIDTSDKDPKSMQKIRGKMSVVSRDIIMMEEIHGYLHESLQSMVVPVEPPEQAGRSLYERLQIREMKGAILLRVTDLAKNLEGSRHELEVLREMSDVVSENRTYRMQESTDNGIKQIIRLTEYQKKASNSLMVLQTILGGSLSFDIMDRITGDWSVADTVWMRPLYEDFIRTTPVVWFIINLFFWLIVAVVLYFVLRHIVYRDDGIITVRMRVEKLIDIDNLNRYLLTKDLEGENHQYDDFNTVTIKMWREPDKREWGGSAPLVEVVYDAATAYMLSMSITYHRRTAKKRLAFNYQELKTRIEQELDHANVFLEKGYEEDEDLELDMLEDEVAK